MTLPIFNLGDEVEVIGTSAKFTITQIQQLPDDERKYSDIGMPYYRAGFLRLVNERPLSPMQVTYTYDPVDCEYRAIQVSCPCGRKAEVALPEKSEWKEVPNELKIGDWVQVIGPAMGGSETERGKIFQISQDKTVCAGLSTLGMFAYGPDSLRKLTPDEALCHITRREPVCAEGRLSEIEKRLSAIETLQFSQQYAIVCFESRLTFVEKFQRDQDDLIGRAIRDGVAEILDFRRKA